VFRPIGSGGLTLWTTGATAEDDRSLSGWSLRDKMHWDDNGTWEDVFRQRIIGLSIRGEANAEGSDLISTIDQQGDGHADDSDIAQRFITGFNPGGYTPTAVERRLTNRNDSTTTPTVSVHSHTPDGPEVASFTGPAALDENTTKNYTFTPSAGSHLAASTLHWLRVQSGSDVRVVRARGELTLNTAADGWNIGTMVNVDDLTAEAIQSKRMKFRLKGVAAPPTRAVLCIAPSRLLSTA